jgi:hypothetical protein
LSFAARVGKDRLEKACQRALQYGDYGYHTIRTILERGLDKNTDDEPKDDQSVPRTKISEVKITIK